MAEPYYPKLSAQVASVVTPPASSTSLATLNVTVQPALREIIFCASAAGVYFNFGTASASSVPVPTAPLRLPLTQTDAAVLRLYGDASKTVNIIQLDTVQQ
jgi:hypothetical protein